MSVFGPNQVEELIIGAGVASQTSVADFIASAAPGELQVVGATGEAIAAGKTFKVLQKTDGDAGKGLNFEFSDLIKPSKVERIVVKQFSPEVQKSVEAVVNTVEEETTYILEVRILNDGGTLSPENFAIVSGYAITGSNVTGVTADNIAAELVASINANLKLRGDSELVVSASGATITLTGKAQRVVPGKIVGRQIEFEVNTKTFAKANPIAENTQLMSHTVLNENNPGTGTGKYAVNLEWFTKGYKYEPYRQTGYPADFGERTPYYADASKSYNAIHITYHDSRISPTVEEQPRVLTMLVERTNLASNADTNDVLELLRVALGADAVPVNLPVA